VVRTLLGSETEYAVAGILTSGKPVEQEVLAGWVLDLACKRHRHLVSGHGMFLENGARFYIDRGPHAEYATPECRDPWQVVRFIRAGERFMEDLAHELPASHTDLEQVMVFRTNVDYSGEQTTWGAHESYLHRVNPQLLPDQLIPHLVSRVVYSGAGGFNPKSSGLEFTLSPRASFIAHAVSGESTGNRGIFHTKDEALARPPYHRLHVLCGESLCSDFAAVLKLGTTALVLAAVDAGRRPGDSIRLARPVAALHAVAADPTCTRRLTLANGGELTAIEIQRHYLAQVEASLESLPDWAPRLCGLWKHQLDILERASHLACGSLDWALKYALYTRRLRASGRTDWTRIAEAARVLAMIEKHAQAAGPPAVAPERVPAAIRLLARRKLSWDDIDSFLALRAEMLEVDLRFGQLGPAGTFNQLAGRRPEYAVVSAAEIEQARTCPPHDTRARARGETIAAAGGPIERTAYQCDWQVVQDHRGRRRLDLSDPFLETAQWTEPAPPPGPVPVPPSAPLLDIELPIFIRRLMG